MITERVIDEGIKYVKNLYQHEGTGHDWWHIWRVLKMAEKIATTEKANIGIVRLASLFHEVTDHKLTGQFEIDLSKTKNWLHSNGLNNHEVKAIVEIIEKVSYKGADVVDDMATIEGKIVQDADRLDALGAIGIARTFAYGGKKGRLLYDPDIQPVNHKSFETYKSSTAPVINHFYEKLLLLKERMHTRMGRKIAERRHTFMEKYLETFFKEWNCN